MTNSCYNLDKFRNRCTGTNCNGCSTCKDTLFRKVVIPTIMGGDEPGQPHAPENGAYTNALVYYEATGISYLYSSDGIYTKIANIDVEGAVTSVNGRDGDVIITLSELGGKNQAQIQAMINDSIINKVDKIAGKGLSTNDYTNSEKTKLASVQTGAEANVQSDWEQDNTGSDDYIKNKPSNLVQDANYVHTDNNYTSSEKTKLAGLSNYDDRELREEIWIVQEEFTDFGTRVISLIPEGATSQNKLADKAFVNSTVQTSTANFRGNWTTWSAVPTDSEDYPEDYTGTTTPSTNDYMVVQDASDYTEETLEGTWRFKYTGDWDDDGKDGWRPEYQVNETPMTAAQLAALNSGATAESIAQITTNQQAISSLGTTKQDKLPISIAEVSGDVINVEELNNGAYICARDCTLTNNLDATIEVQAGTVFVKNDSSMGVMFGEGLYYCDFSLDDWSESYSPTLTEVYDAPKSNNYSELTTVYKTIIGAINELNDIKVTNTNYATTTAGGVIRISGNYATGITNIGQLRAEEKTYSQYASLDDDAFIAKGTLDNLIEGRSIRSTWTGTQAAYEALTTYDDNTDYRIVEA